MKHIRTDERANAAEMRYGKSLPNKPAHECKSRSVSHYGLTPGPDTPSAKHALLLCTDTQYTAAAQAGSAVIWFFARRRFGKGAGKVTTQRSDHRCERRRRAGVPVWWH